MANRKPFIHAHNLQLVLSLLLLAHCSTGGDAKQCRPCGSKAVPYPLSTAADCGDPSYKVHCVNSTGVPSLFFHDLEGFSYPVTSISPSSQRLVIHPAPFASGTSCTTADLPSGGVHLNSSLPFKITGSNTIMLLNCTSSIRSSPINCSDISICHAYANAAGSDAAACAPSSMICCTFVAGGSSSYEVEVSMEGCTAYRSFVNLDAAGTPTARWADSAGLELQWASPKEPLCRSQEDCEGRSNVTCAADPESRGALSRCFCVKGRQWDPFSGMCVDNIISSGAHHWPLIEGLVLGLGSALPVSLLAGFLLCLWRRRRRESRKRLAKEREEILNANNSSIGRSLRDFTGREIKQATANFSCNNLLGSGGHGEVYKGQLPDGTLLAVKCAKLENKSTEQVLNEVRILSQVNHRSFVRLLGCCVELDRPIMVYEFIRNGTLYDHLHGLRPLLPWASRLVIARQTAEGLAYLHSSVEPPIYHRDVKSSNILLDEMLNAKISDFGLSRLADPGHSHVSTCAQGTLGYLDPEYYRSYQLTDKSDVYSFGVVLLELLTSQKAIDFGRGPDDVNLAVHVQRKVEEERLMEAVDGALKEGAGQVELDTMKAIGFLAVGCLEEKRQNRPSMKEVAEEIEYIMNILKAVGGET